MKPCWAQYLLWMIITLAGVGAMLSGCGQAGPLYLPDDAGSQEEKDGR
ncbi:MAG: lipoprotein [Thiogranum sp.]